MEHKSGHRDRKSLQSTNDIRSQKGPQQCESDVLFLNSHFITNIVIKFLYQFFRFFYHNFLCIPHIPKLATCSTHLIHLVLIVICNKNSQLCSSLL